MTTVDILKEYKALEDALKCPNCKNILDDPYILGKCCHTICKSCFVGQLNRMCPICNVLINSKDLQEDKQLKSLLILASQLNTALDDQSKERILSDSKEKSKEENFNKETMHPLVDLQIESLSSNMIKHKDPAVQSDRSPMLSTEKSTILETTLTNAENSRQSFSTPSNKNKIRKPTASQIYRKKVCQSIKNLNLNTSVRSSPGNFHKKNHKGETPLQVAVIKGDKIKVEDFLEQGADPNTKDHCGWTPLHEASIHGYLDIAEVLIDHGAFVNVPGHQNITPLHDAIINNQMEVAKMLASRGADVFARTSLGYTALDLCQSDKDRKGLADACPVHISPSITLPSNKALENKKILILATSLNDAQKVTLQKCADMLKAEVTTEYTTDVTHLIAACDEMGHCTRTLKVLMGILSGKWILNFQWVEVCLEYKQKVEEEVFEVPGIKNQPEHQGPKRARENFLQQLPLLFDGCYFYLHGTFKKPTPEREDLINLIHQGGGKILTREPRHDSIDQNPYMIPYHASGTTLEDFNHFILYQDKPPRGIQIQINHIYTAHVLWLIECVSGFQLLDPAKVSIPK